MIVVFVCVKSRFLNGAMFIYGFYRIFRIIIFFSLIWVKINIHILNFTIKLIFFGSN